MLDGEGTLLLNDLIHTVVGIYSVLCHCQSYEAKAKAGQMIDLRKLVSISEKAIMEPSNIPDQLYAHQKERDGYRPAPPPLKRCVSVDVCIERVIGDLPELSLPLSGLRESDGVVERQLYKHVYYYSHRFEQAGVHTRRDYRVIQVIQLAIM